MWNDNDDRIMRLLPLAGENCSVFPEVCPICGARTGHVYMHRYKEGRGGIWIWCSSCHSYSHMSSIIPDWWENPEYIDEDKLNHSPECLDQQADILDSWINSLSKHSEEDSHIDLKPVGIFKEMSYGNESDPSIKEYIGSGNEENSLRICGYLNSGVAVIVSPEVLYDVLSPSKVIAGTATAFTDGEWIWSGDLSYYVKNYNLQLPEEFLATMVRNELTVPVNVSDIDLSSISINGISLNA